MGSSTGTRSVAALALSLSLAPGLVDALSYVVREGVESDVCVIRSHTNTRTTPPSPTGRGHTNVLSRTTVPSCPSGTDRTRLVKTTKVDNHNKRKRKTTKQTKHQTTPTHFDQRLAAGP